MNKCVNIHNLSNDYLKFEAHFDCFSSHVLLNILITEKHLYSWAVCLVSFLHCVNLLFRGREIEFDFILSLSTSFRYKDCDKQESHEGYRGVDQEGHLAGGGVIEVGVSEGCDKGEDPDPANRQPGNFKLSFYFVFCWLLTRLCRF